jgi:hypothetical protein
VYGTVHCDTRAIKRNTHPTEQNNKQTTTTTKKREMDQRSIEAIDAKLDMINGRFDLPEETVEAMKLIRESLSEVANKVRDNLDQKGIKYDVGTMIRFVALIQDAKNLACDAIILPHAPKRQKRA